MKFPEEHTPAIILLASFSNLACGEGPTETDRQNELKDTGGVSGDTGGAFSSSGGTLSASGGAVSGSGGSSVDSGGSASQTGGSDNSSGGAPSGQTGVGGSGGSYSDGTGGIVEGSGGASEDGEEALQSVGCGLGTSASTCATSGSPCTLNVAGEDRAFYVVLPNDYDADRAYPVVFQFHPLGGSAEQGMNMYRVQPNFPDAIYVTPQGLKEGNNTGWGNSGGQDEELTRAIIDQIELDFCIDRSRYFSTGFSYGGSMSFTAALCMNDIFRGIGAMAGAPISGAGQCTPQAPVAAWINHGVEDTALPIEMALPLRDALVEINGCSMTTQPVEPSPCVEYQDCKPGYPVVWCEVEGMGHAIPDYSPTAIADFFQQF